MTKKITLAFLLTMLSSYSFAGLMIDPYFGSSNASAVVDGIPAVYDNKGSASGTTFGARGGLKFALFSAGLDYGVFSTEKTDATDMSLFVGVDLPFFFRFWGEYYLSSEGTSIYLDQFDLSADLAFNDGYSIGIGFTGLPLVSVNFEAITKNYTVKNSMFGDLDVAYADYIISLSIPFSI